MRKTGHCFLVATLQSRQSCQKYFNLARFFRNHVTVMRCVLPEDTLTNIIDKARQIRNPVGAAFFLWVNVAYPQPPAEGNERASRLCANMPFLLHDCAAPSFLEVEHADHAAAMPGVCKQRHVAAVALDRCRTAQAGVPNRGPSVSPMQ